MALAIGEVARRSGCSVATVRYYEEIGLISAAARSQNGRRTYGYPDLSRLSFIRRARDCGMPIEKVRELLAASALPANVCASAKPVIASQLVEVRRKRAELAKLERSLVAMIERCETQCDAASSCCTIIDDIEASHVAAS